MLDGKVCLKFGVVDTLFIKFGVVNTLFFINFGVADPFFIYKMVDKTLVVKVNIKFGAVRGKKGSTIPNLRQNVHDNV